MDTFRQRGRVQNSPGKKIDKRKQGGKFRVIMNKQARSRKFSAKQSARLGAYLAAGVGASIGASDAEAAIVFFDVNPDRTFGLDGTLNFGSINLGAGTYVLNGTSGATFGLTFPGYFGGLDGYLRPLGNIEWGFSGNYVDRLALNNSISGTSGWSWGATPSAVLLGGYVGADGNWGFSGPGDSKSGFAPLRINAGGGNFHYGWVEVTTQAGNIFSPPYLGTATVTVTGFAFEDQVNTAILAGDKVGPAPIPEPGTWAAAALLVGGAAYVRWRKRRDEAQKEAA